MTPDDDLLVSICIPTYNRAGLIGRAIASALDQTYTKLEVIVVDNASTDNTRDIVAKFNDPRLSYIRNEKNLGLFGNFNRCLELARGDLIHILHSDDTIDKKFTETCVQFFQGHPDVMLTFTSAEIIRGTKMIGRIIPRPQTTIFKAPDGFRQILMTRALIVCPSVMVRKKIISKGGIFSLDFPYSADYFQWLKIGKDYDIAFIREAVLFYHQGEHSESFRLLFNSVAGYEDTLNIYRSLKTILGNERNLFEKEMNTALQRFILDTIYAGFTRSRTIQPYNPIVFIRLSMNAADLMILSTFGTRVRQLIIYAVIAGSGLLMVIPGIRHIIGALLRWQKSELY